MRPISLCKIKRTPICQAIPLDVLWLKRAISIALQDTFGAVGAACHIDILNFDSSKQIILLRTHEEYVQFEKVCEMKSYTVLTMVDQHRVYCLLSAWRIESQTKRIKILFLEY